MVLSASLFVVRFAVHDCPGEGCAICYEIGVSLSMIGQAGIDNGVAGIAAAVRPTAVLALAPFALMLPAMTLVALRTRLDD